MNFVDSVESFFKKYTIIDGRSSRSEYWYVVLFSYLIMIPLDFIEMLLFNKEYWDPMFLSTIFSFIILIPLITVTARRFHDINMSGWWQLIPITIIGIIPYIYWLTKKGDDTNNKYGSNPLRIYDKLG